MIPIIMLLVAVATLSGTPIATFITGTLTIPPPTPRSADDEARADRGEHAEPEASTMVAGRSGEVAGVEAAWRPQRPAGRRLGGHVARGVEVGVGGLLVAVAGGAGGCRRAGVRRRADHRDRDPGEHHGEQAARAPLVEHERDEAPGERAHRGEQLEDHAQSQVRDVPRRYTPAPAR